MKRATLLILFVCLVFALAAMAQTSSSSQTPPSTSSQSSSTTQSSTTPDTQTGSMGSQSQSASRSIEGCIVRSETDYFIQPVDGTNRVRLRGNTADLGSHVGHRVRLSGSQQSASTWGTSGTGAGTTASAGTGGTTGMATKPETSAGSNYPSSGTSTTGNVGASTGTSSTSSGMGTSTNAAQQDFMVSRVDMISTNCPVNTGSQTPR